MRQVSETIVLVLSGTNTEFHQEDVFLVDNEDTLLFSCLSSPPQAKVGIECYPRIYFHTQIHIGASAILHDLGGNPLS